MKQGEFGSLIWKIPNKQDNNKTPGNSLWPFWDGEFTWPELKGDVGDLQWSGIKFGHELNHLADVVCVQISVQKTDVDHGQSTYPRQK